MRTRRKTCCGALVAGLAVALASASALLAPASAAVPVQVLAHAESSRGLTRLEVALAAGAQVPTGLGLAVAFDSITLELLDIEGLFAAGLLGAPPSPEPDATDLDGDPRTDTVMRFAWLSAAGGWEADGGGVTLLRLAFGERRTAPTEIAVVPLGSEPRHRFECLRVRPHDAGRRPARVLHRAPRQDVPTLGGVTTLESRAWVKGGEGAVRAALTPTCSLDVDGNAGFDALTDGILMMRHLFGFSGATLVKDALGSGATRTTGEAVSSLLNNAACLGMLDVDGSGHRDALTDGVLAARYLFGFTGASLVSGALGAGATRTSGEAIAGHLDTFRGSGPILVLRAPVLAAPLLSQIEASLLVGTTYTGDGRLTYTLAQSPPGMTLDPQLGWLTWMPPASLEGQQATVKVTATDGTLAAEVTFALQVGGGTQLTTSLSGTTVTVTQPGTLQGLAIALPGQTSIPAAQIKVFAVPEAQAPPLHSGIARLSDFFRVTPVQATGGDITLAMPAGGLPAGVSADHVRLYVHAEAEVSAEHDALTERAEWLSSSWSLDVRPGRVVAVRVDRLGQLSFIGYDASAAGSAGNAASSAPLTDGEGTVQCAPKVHSSGLVSGSEVVCRSQVIAQAGQRAVTVVVRGFATNQWTPAATEAELVGWVQTANAHFLGLGMTMDATLEVVVEEMPKPKWLGWVTSKNGENLRILHLSRGNRTKDKMKSTIAHEYFHHAQSRTTAAGTSNAINLGARLDWIAEGTARWAEDEVFDSISSYRDLNAEPHPLVLVRGVAAPPQFVDNDPAKGRVSGTSPYDRFLWWKMMRLSCSGFSIPETLNFNATADPSGLQNLITRIASATWQCDFGAGFGEDNKATMAAALLYYTFATVKEDNISLIDANEPHFPSEPTPAELTPSDACAGNWSQCPDTAKLVGRTVRTGAAVPVRLLPVLRLDPGMLAFIRVNNTSSAGTLWAWIGDNEKPGGLTQGQWAKVEPGKNATIGYAAQERAPASMVILVNPNPGAEVGYELFAGIGSAYSVFPDLDQGISAPIFSYGTPEADFTLVLRSGLAFPSQYRVVWGFGDGTPEATVTGAPTVSHRWTSVGTFEVTASLFSLPDNTLVGRARGAALIGYFRGIFQLDSFTGGTTGEFGAPESQAFLQFLAGVAANPSAARVSVSRWSNGGLDAYLYSGSDSSYLAHYSPVNDNDTPDCRQHFTITDHRLSARWANPQYGFASGEKAGMCMSLEMTQTGTRIDGTFSLWAKYYQFEGPPVTKGEANYTFSGTYRKK